MKLIRLSILVGLSFGLTHCSDDVGPYTPINLEVEIPSNFPDLTYTLENNPVTDAGFDLGKKLFYEGRLSVNNSIPCAFCHEQAFAFTHHGHTLSHGVNGEIGLRNAPPIQNMAFQKEFMWDGAATHLDLQPIIPLTSDVEMGETLANVLAKLKKDPEYKTLFRRAFGESGINAENLLKALSQFMVMMISSNSTYDKYVRNEDNVQLSPLELAGLYTFKSKCSSCHAGELFTDQSYRNNGLPVNPKLMDKGRYAIFEDENDLYKFKVPSLRNIEVTFPYMHDGRFQTLEAVLNFYDHGMTNNGNVDPSLLRPDGSYGIDLTTEEKESLIAFLKTLTDTEFLNDERFAEY
ncbi:cytochrome-c peroxidase [Flavobacteriaceae bacterium F08102]|nr:cytochrome-c peroxidase [Flavobacteriaceae bacterium F08102]